MIMRFQKYRFFALIKKRTINGNEKTNRNRPPGKWRDKVREYMNERGSGTWGTCE